MSSDKAKHLAAEAALAMIKDDMIIGVGSGSTVNCFIAKLGAIKGKIGGAIAASIESEKKLKAQGIPILDLNSSGNLSLYIDGADAINANKQLIKGAGGAMTREKIIAFNAERFVCIADQHKYVQSFKAIAIPVEVLPMARSYVAREIVKLGGVPDYRVGYVTDNHNTILDIYDLDCTDLLALEKKLKAITGVVETGIFAQRCADVILLATDVNVQTI